MRAWKLRVRAAALALAVAFVTARLQAAVFPQAAWEIRTPEQVGLRTASLDGLRSYLGGRGAVVRNGYLVYTWGNVHEREDVASAAKPLYTFFLFKAVEQGLLWSPGARAGRAGATCLLTLNPSLKHKDSGITFRHMANQMSGYGVREAPGQVFDYNDWQSALFWDTLFLDVWDTSYAAVDAAVLGPQLSSKLRFQDAPTLMAFGTDDRPGRLAISPLDFCRFGLLYLRHGDWNGVRVLSEELALTAVTRPVPREMPRTEAIEADMCPDQRSLGSTVVPDDQIHHDGGYAWGWWVNGRALDGWRRWPHGESNVYAALGHDERRGLAVLPCLDLVVSWNDGRADGMDEILRRLYEAAGRVPVDPPRDVGPALRLRKITGGTVRLEWSGDDGTPRFGEHYHVLRGTDPLGLDLAPGSHPGTALEFTEPVAEDALVFYRVVAASRCEQVSED